jgi:hypothetical protein
LILRRVLNGKTGELHPKIRRRRIDPGIVYVAKGEPVLVRAIVIQPQHPLRAGVGFAVVERSAGELNRAAIVSVDGIPAKLNRKRIGCTSQGSQVLQIPIEARI